MSMIDRSTDPSPRVALYPAVVLSRPMLLRLRLLAKKALKEHFGYKKFITNKVKTKAALTKS